MLDREHTIAVTLPTSVRVLLPHGRVEEMKLETYLAGVVATEIGASAPLEALKAQAVAARTYAAAAHRHPEHAADVCTTAHCQKWKRVDPVVAPEVFRALSETWGMVALCDGKLIDAFFFEHCDGHTRNSEDMLMPTIKYLRGVDCSCGFLTLKGHGVGMCKRGAIVMARRGASFEQILRHYYRGVVVIHTGRENQIAAPPVEMPAPPREPAPRVRKAPEPKRIRRTKPERVKRAPRRTPPSFDSAQDAAPRPAIRRAPTRAEVPAPAARRVEMPRAPTPVAAKPVEEKSAEVTIIAESARPSAAIEPSTEKLRDVIAGEVVAKPDAVTAKPLPPAKPPRRVHIDHLPGSRMIAGCLPEIGITILIEDPRGNKAVTLSGSAPHYGEGGFETIVEEDGRYLVTLDDQVVEIHVDGETVFIHAN